MTGESVSLIDTDVHNYTRSIDDLIPHLSLRWKTYIIQGGIKLPGVSLYPKMYAQAARRDAIPYEGGVAGSEPAFRENNDSILRQVREVPSLPSTWKKPRRKSA